MVPRFHASCSSSEPGGTTTQSNVQTCTPTGVRCSMGDTGQITGAAVMSIPVALLVDQPWTLPPPATLTIVAVLLLGGAWSTLVNLGLFAAALASGASLARAMSICFLSLVFLSGMIQFFVSFAATGDGAFADRLTEFAPGVNPAGTECIEVASTGAPSRPTPS